MKKALTALAFLVVLAAPVSGHAKPQPDDDDICFKWDGKIVCIELPEGGVGRKIPKPGPLPCLRLTCLPPI